MGFIGIIAPETMQLDDNNKLSPFAHKAGMVGMGVGGLVSLNAVPDALAPAYGGHHPLGAMGFVHFTLM